MRKLNYSTEIPDQLLDHFTFAAGSQSERIGLTLQQPPKLDATKIRLTAPTREPDSNEMGNNDHQPPLPTPLTARPIWSTGRAHPTEQQEQELQSKQQEWLLQHELPQLPARQTVTTHALSRQRTVRSGQTSVVNNAPQSQCWPKNRSHRAQSLDSRSKSTEITKYDYGTHYENVLELIATPSRIANSTSCCCTPVIQSNANLCKNPSVDHCDDCAVNNANAKCFNKFELTCKTVNKCNIIKNNLPVYHPLVDLPSSPSESSSGPNCAHLSSSTGASGSSSNQSVGRRRVQHTVRRIGVFYSDLCDVIRTMRPASSTISTITAATTNPHHHLASETHCIERSSFKRQKSRPNSCQEDGQHTMAKHSPIMQTSSGINQATLNHNETIDRNDSIDHHHHSVTTVEAAAIDTIDSAQSCALDSSSLFVFPTLIHSRGSIASSGLLPLATPNHHHHHQFHGPIAGSAQHYQHHLSHHLHHHHHPLPDLLHHPNLTPTTPATLSTHYISTASGASLPIDAHLMHHSHVLGGSTNRLSGANSMTPSNGTVAACSSASSGNHNALLPLPHLPRLAHCGSPSLPKPCLHCAHLGARWFVLLVALIGLLCALLGAYLLCSNTRPDQLPLALLMLGVGLLLIAISGLALRLSSNPSPNSGRNSSDSRCATDLERRFLPRPPVASVRAQHPYGAMLYSEFEYRPPPPTYAASMQQHRLRLAAFRRGLSGRRSCTWSSLLNGLSGFSGLNGLSPFNVASNRIGNGTSSGSGPPIESLQNPVHMNVASPPPTYRNSPTSSPAESLRRPPSYRTAVRDHKQLPPSLLSSHNNQDDNGDNINSIESTPGEHPSIDESPNIMTSNQRPIASELQILAHL